MLGDTGEIAGDEIKYAEGDVYGWMFGQRKIKAIEFHWKDEHGCSQCKARDWELLGRLCRRFQCFWSMKQIVKQKVSIYLQDILCNWIDSQMNFMETAWKEVASRDWNKKERWFVEK